MKATRRLSILALALALPFAAAASEPAAHAAPAARLAAGDCPRAEDGPELLRFAHYPAARRVRIWAAPVLASREARLHRSALGAEVANGPNFAGDYTLAAWGCGNACTQAAIVAARTGRIFFPPQLRAISTARVGTWDGGRALRYRGLRFCRDSRLLAVVGQNGDRQGTTYFEWTGTALREIPAAPGAAHRR
ncbi:MAG: hypothetical protein QOD42_2533 [Sphingomonadales bacterium]|jgi:hypothetical protein|nr:hypothetical protein [Sphingomonadales bacterium]